MWDVVTMGQVATTQGPAEQATTKRGQFWRTIEGLVANPTATMIGTVDSNAGRQVATKVGSVLRVAGQDEGTGLRMESKRP